MPTALTRPVAAELVEPNWRTLYNFVFRLTLNRDRTERYLIDMFSIAACQLADAPPQSAARLPWLIKIANKILEERLPRQPEVNFDILDDTLAS